MLRLLRKKEAFASMLEVIITSVIFTLAAFGIISTISLLRPQGNESYRKLEAAYEAKKVFDELRGKITAETWGTGDFEPYTLHQLEIEKPGYNMKINYVLYDDVLQAGIRTLVMNIYYPDS